MPIYKYRCSCGNEKEITCKMSEYSPTTECECGKIMERKTEDLVCGLSIDNTGSFYRKTN